jgi:hypothetical protein
MGAYENPETFIDTQTSKYYQGLQETIAGSFANVAQSYAAKQAELKKQREETAKILKANDMKANEYAFSMYSDLAKSTASDPSVDWSKTFDPLINEAKDIRLGMLNGSLANNQTSMKRLAQINASVDGVTKSLATLSAVGATYTGALAKGVNVPGGLSTVNNPKVTEALDVLTQRLPGKKEVFFKDNDPTKLMWRVMNAKGETLQEFDADQLDKISRGNGLITVIPNLTVDNDKIKTSNTNIFDVTTLKDGTPIPNGQIKSDYLRYKDGKPVGEWKLIGAPGKEIYQFNQEVDVDAMKTDANLRTTLIAQAQGILKSNEKEAIALMNDTFAPQAMKAGNKNAVNFDPNKALTDEEKNQFINAYAENFFTSQVPKTQTILKPDEDILALIPEKPDKTKEKKEGSGKTSKGKESIESITKRIWNTKVGDIADFTYDGRKVSYDGGSFLVERTAGLKDLMFETKKDVINYLKTGSTSKPKP